MHGDRGAGVGQPLRERCPDPAAGAGDERDAIREILYRHGASLRALG